jgi:hypothetical protein
MLSQTNPPKAHFADELILQNVSKSHKYYYIIFSALVI